METKAPVSLFTLLATHANTKALKTGEVASPLVKFDFADVKVSNTQFKPLVREAKYDLGELAIVTFLQAALEGKPYILLPATVVGRSQHHTIFYNSARGALRPQDLNGKRVGVRSYTQTTGAWVRGFLAEDYGVDVNGVRWVTFEAPHITEYTDPSFVERAPEGKVLKQMLLDGEIDAAILGDYPEEGPLKHLVPDPEAAARIWARGHGGIPINHLMVVRQEIARDRPNVVREVYRLLRKSREAATSISSGEDDPLRFGVKAVRRSLEQMVEYAFQQNLIARKPSADALFEEARHVLGPDAE